MIRAFAFLILSSLVLLSGCTRTLTAEERAQVQALSTELDATKKEIAAAELQNGQPSGGSVKALLSLRLDGVYTMQTPARGRR